LYSFANFGLWVSRCDLQMCTMCVGFLFKCVGKNKIFPVSQFSNYMFKFSFQYFQFKFYCFSLFALQVTVCIRIVADFGSRIFQFTTNVVADYNVHIYYYIRLLFLYFVSCLGFIFRSVDSVGKAILFCNFGSCFGFSELQMCMAFSVGLSVHKYVISKQSMWRTN